MGKHLHELLGCPGPMTHRQFLAWQAWLEDDLDRPSRSDAYSMQVACEVRRSVAKNPRQVNLSDFLLRFHQARTNPHPQQAALAKSVWLGRMTMPPVEVESEE